MGSGRVLRTAALIKQARDFSTGKRLTNLSVLHEIGSTAGWRPPHAEQVITVRRASRSSPGERTQRRAHSRVGFRRRSGLIHHNDGWPRKGGAIIVFDYEGNLSSKPTHRRFHHPVQRPVIVQIPAKSPEVITAVS